MKTSPNHHENQKTSPSADIFNKLDGFCPTTVTTRSDPTIPYPMIFVHANTSNFKEVVQTLTRSFETVKNASARKSRQGRAKNPIPPIRSTKKEKALKLYERRNRLKDFNINPLARRFENCSVSHRKPTLTPPEILSPSMLKFPGLVLSPVTPLLANVFNRSPQDNNGSPIFIDMEAENEAIARKGFYLHPSASHKLEPQLLPLFPVTSSPQDSQGSS